MSLPIYTKEGKFVWKLKGLVEQDFTLHGMQFDDEFWTEYDCASKDEFKETIGYATLLLPMTLGITAKCILGFHPAVVGVVTYEERLRIVGTLLKSEGLIFNTAPESVVLLWRDALEGIAVLLPVAHTVALFAREEPSEDRQQVFKYIIESVATAADKMR